MTTTTAEATAPAVRLRAFDRHPRALAFIRSTAKRRIVRAGRRGGKTTSAARVAVERFCKGGRVLYATPTSDQLDAFWHEVKRSLADALDLGVLYKNESLHVIELLGTKQRIRAKTAWNADTLRGDYADLLILDEWQLMDEDAWELVGAPMLLDNDGDAVFVYTPPSLRSRSVSKARDPRHAAKMYAAAEKDMTGRWRAFHFTSHDNPYISQTALREITGDMTNLAYRQEILAEDIDEVPGAPWKRSVIEDTRVGAHPGLVRVVVGVDPAGASGPESDETGIVVAGLGADGHGYVLDDRSLQGSPAGWASAAVTGYYAHRADRIIGEVNNGGEMVGYTIATIDGSVAYKAVHASRGKLTRAEPIAALYEQGRVHHVGAFPDLEDQMCTWVPGDKSPDRMDALVWALTELFLEPGAMPDRAYYDDPVSISMY